MRLLAGAALTMIVLSAAPLAACGEDEPVPDSIEQVKKRHEAELMAVPGVVSVGIAQADDGRSVIVVGLERESLEAERRLPQRLEGYEVQKRVVGRIRPQ